MLFAFIVFSSLAYAHAGAKSPTPQMGWNSWNKFACDIDEDLIKQTADALVDSGLAKLGYNFVNLDDCWQASTRDENGVIQPDPVRFPSGLKALGDYVHSRGLKFGIYSSAGFKTCQAFPASLGLEEVDAASYAEWGVDYLKYDNCYQDHGLPTHRYGAMEEALEGSGRDIFYSLCEWGRENPATWAPGIGADSWRISGDIRDSWRSIIERAEIGASLWRFAGPTTGWNDPDMLEIGNGGCSDDEYRTHFSLWAMLKAPLIIGNDIRNFSTPSPENAAVLEILGNKEVIAVSQDPLGRQARLTWSDTTEKLRNSDIFGDKLIATKCATGAVGAYEDAKESQEWSYEADGTIKSASTGRCLTELDLRAAELLAPLVQEGELLLNRTARMHSVSTASCDVATKWDVEQNVGGSIVSRASGLCLEVAKEDPLPVFQGKRVQTSQCRSILPNRADYDVTEHQSWTSPAATLRNLYQRQCLTIDSDAMTGLLQEVWVTPMAGDALAVVLLNKSPLPAVMSLDAAKIGMSTTDTTVYKLRDLWLQEALTRTFSADSPVEFKVNAHGVVMLKLTPK